MITRIEATHYRCFDKLGVPMDSFNVLAGANGSGKTTLLDVPVVLRDLVESSNVSAAFMESILERGARASSLDELVFRAHGESFILAIEAKFASGHRGQPYEARTQGGEEHFSTTAYPHPL